MKYPILSYPDFCKIANFVLDQDEASQGTMTNPQLYENYMVEMVKDAKTIDEKNKEEDALYTKKDNPFIWLENKTDTPATTPEVYNENKA